MNDPRHYQETHDFCQETKKKSKSRNLLQQRLDETIGKNIKEEKQRKIPSPFFLKEESLTDQEASLEETEKDSKFVWENDLEIKELETAYKEESAEKRYRRLTQGVNLLIILLCIYTGFLIFGVAVTQYHYSDNGTIEAQKLSVSDIREKKEYEKILAQYINLRTIYQSVLLLDYQYDQNADEHMTIATEYEKILDDILKASTQIKALDIEEYLEYLKLYEKDGKTFTNTERGIARKLASLKTFYNYFFKKELIVTNPAALVSAPKLHDKTIIRLDIDEVARLLDNVESGEQLTGKQLAYHEKTKVRDLALLTLFLGTGIRVSECVGLNIDDIDLKNNGIKIIRKGGNEVIVYFGDEVLEALLPYLEERKQIEALPGHTNALFLSMQKKRMSVRSVENLVKKYAKTVTTMKNITPHKLRSTYGTNLYNETGDIYLVADVLGHKDVNTTKKHYASLEDSRRRMAARAVTLREKQ